MVLNRSIFVIIFFLFFTLINNSLADKANAVKYIIYFDDNKVSEYNCYEPESYLSQQSIFRRTKQNIVLDETDLPLSPIYYYTLENLNARILGVSKWLNAIAIEVSDRKDLEKYLLSLPYVSYITYAGGREIKSTTISSNTKSMKNPSKEMPDELIAKNIGASMLQIEQCNALELHKKGYRGNGINIAVLDGGFLGVDSMSCFDYLRSSGKIIDTWDFVNKDKNVFKASEHGTQVLSVLAANLPEYYVGTAPEANYWLLKTENTITEELIEEFYFVMALEYADSAGVDIVNASIGYNYFDDMNTSHTWDELEGQNVMATRAVNIAAHKGMLILVSAGNDGNGKWKYISFPADAQGALTVGAVDIHSKPAKFSSKGFVKNDYVKPNLSALGYKIPILNLQEQIIDGFGTSFSTPVISGLMACLWQAFYEAKVEDLITSVQQSASSYLTPNARIGYGIPNFQIAHALLNENITNYTKNEKVKMMWNVEESSISLLFDRRYNQVIVHIIDDKNLLIKEYQFLPKGAKYLHIRDNSLRVLKKGIYFININVDNKNFYYKLVI
jgi:subtilisin family serine protease